MPHLDESPHTSSKMSSRRGECKSIDRGFEGQVVENYTMREVGEDGVAIIVDGEQ